MDENGYRLSLSEISPSRICFCTKQVVFNVLNGLDTLAAVNVRLLVLMEFPV